MPTYDYECDACDHKFELFQYISEDPKSTCPECGEDKLRRLFGTGAAVMFKGSGFYQTDYRSDSYKKAAEADKKAGESGKSEGSKSKSKSKSSGSESGSKPQPKSESSE